MERKHFNYALMILLTLLLQLHGGIGKDSEVANRTQNNTKNINIENFQVKTTKGTDVSQLQLQEVQEAAAKKNKTIVGEGKTMAINSNVSEKSRRRQMPPPNFNIKEPNHDSIESVPLDDTKKPKERVVVVAQNVVLNITDTAPKAKTTKLLGTPSEPINVTLSNSTIHVAAPPFQEKAIQVTPMVPANKINVDDNIVNSTIESTSVTPITKLMPTPPSTTRSSKITTTTPKPKPKKPLITYGVEDFPDLDEHILNQPSASTNSPSKFPIYELEVPHAQPSQEHDASVLYRQNRDYVVPIVAIMFLTPLLVGVVITAYRRFRDFWSTRHYRRMDFLVDGMYND